MLVSTLFILLTTGCGRDPALPDMLWEASPSPARSAYFDALAAGRYDDLDPIIGDLTAEAAEGDDTSLAVLGFAHGWRASERLRVPPDGAIIGNIDLAVSTFDRAVDAIPDDPRLVGFRGGFLQAQGSAWGDDALSRQGWFDTQESARRWPEWGLFTQAYGLVSFPPDDPMFQTGIDLFWKNVDECANERVPREGLDWSAYEAAIADGDDLWDLRACGNTPVVPHGVEGFFTIFGDALAKGGDLAAADEMYANALGAREAEDWPYRELAESRRAQLDDLPELLSAEPPEDGPVDPSTMLVFGGPASCAICHQATAE